MLSAMTTSENFSLRSQPRCATTAYRSIAGGGGGGIFAPPMGSSDCGGDLLLERTFSDNLRPTTDADVIANESADRQVTMGGDFRVTPNLVCGSVNACCGGLAVEEAAKPELEADLTELLEQFELEDLPDVEQAKPLKIDPNVLKLNFSNLSSVDWASGERDETNYRSLDEFCTRIAARENARASHHLSGGGLLADSSNDARFHPFADPGSKSRFCALSDGGCISTESVFDLADLSLFDSRRCEAECKPSAFLNQISPSSPLTFDLTAQSELNVTKGNLTNAESTNPFSDSLREEEALDGEDVFSPTNPFADGNFPSSPDPFPAPSPDYENLSVPQKSFSQCSTRPASPIARTVPEEPSLSNPFLLNRASPQPQPQPPPAPFQPESVPNRPSSVIIALPFIPIFPPYFANSRTQGSNPSEPSSAMEPVYQNLTNQLKKFLQRNNHSEYDLQCLKRTMRDLRNSGWYYENVSWQESIVLLKNTEPGTFLIRDSSDPNFLFSLSVQTSRGPTSVRLHYVNGQFRLDAEEKLIPHMPSFSSVIKLIDYYIENTVKNKFVSSQVRKTARKGGRERLQKSKEQVWIDSQGNVYSNILLVKPLYKKEHFSTLQHLARLAINRFVQENASNGGVGSRKLNFRVTPVYESSPFQESSFPVSFDCFGAALNVDDLPLPITLINYLKDYPYCH